jgi:hypothetical protein
MKKSSQSSVATVEPIATHAHGNGGNGTAVAAVAESPPELSVVLAPLQTIRNGDFSVRLPGSWTGLSGKIADTFNDIVAANPLGENLLTANSGREALEILLKTVASVLAK